MSEENMMYNIRKNRKGCSYLVNDKEELVAYLSEDHLFLDNVLLPGNEKDKIFNILQENNLKWNKQCLFEG